ncbi:T9SS type A sorting domain-containing protein [Flavobacterium sp. XGLA_31]|uniref:T9SS type A sorting domain-containing protein n=1 Tax=Flavobacterium sp. XGLA_31 TaxID=3447666 RepID=UPI003F3B132B
MRTKLLLVLTLIAAQFSSVYAETLTSPILPNIQPLTYCDSNNDGIGVFDLTVVTPQILAVQSGLASNYQIIYQESFGSNTISNPGSYSNINPWNQTVYYSIIEISSGDLALGSFQIVVNPKPQLITSAPPYTLCDDNQDGIAVFDLTSLIPDLLQGAAYNVTFHETQTDAEIGGAGITTPFAYTNIYPFAQTIYARGTDPVTGCYTVVPVVLEVSPAPIIDALPPIALCDGDANPQDGVASVNLAQQTAVILASQALPPSNYSVTYYTSLAAAQSEVSPILTTQNYVGTNGAILWYRIENNATGCYNVGSFHLVIAGPLSLTTPTVYAVCDSDAQPNNQYTYFDLNVKNSEITQGLPGYTVTYYPSYPITPSSVAIANPTAYVNVQPAVQTLGVMVTSPSGCVSYTTLDIRVYPIPLPNTNPNTIVACDTDGNGSELVDLTVNTTYITNGNPNLILHYYATQYDLDYGINEILTPTVYMASGGNVYIKVTNTFTGSNGYPCYRQVTQPVALINNSAPNVMQPNYPPYQLCNNSGIEGMGIFNLASQTAFIAMGQPNVTVVFYPSFADALNGTNAITNLNYVNVTSYVQTLGIRVINSCSGAYSISTMDINVMPSPHLDLISNNTLNTVYVDGSNNVVQPLLLDTQLNSNYTYQWELNGAPLPNALASTYLVATAIPGGGESVFSVTATDINTGCVATDSIVVSQSDGVPSPSGPISQTFNPGETLAYLTVAGSNVLWYASAANKNTTSTPLPLTTLLVDGTTYYASQTIGGIESAARLPVTVHAALGVPGNEIASLKFAPNPIKDVLTLQSTVILKSIAVYSMLGQKVFEQNYNNMDITIDLSRLASGNYILRAQGETNQKTIRIVKE